MFDEINAAIKEAMKEQNKPKLAARRMLKSRLLENRTAKVPKSELDVATQYQKQLRDSYAAFPEGSSQREALEEEMTYISPFLPKPMTEADVANMIAALVTAEPNRDFGAVMKQLSPAIKGRFDGKLAATMVRDALGAKQ